MRLLRGLALLALYHTPREPDASNRNENSMGHSDGLGTEKLRNVEGKSQSEHHATPS